MKSNLMCISQIINDFKCVFICVLGFRDLSSIYFLFSTLTIFLLRLLFFSFRFMSSLYILDINSWLILDTNIFSNSVTFLWTCKFYLHGIDILKFDGIKSIHFEGYDLYIWSFRHLCIPLDHKDILPHFLLMTL